MENFDEEEKDSLCAGVDALRDAIAAAAGTGTKAFIDLLLATMARTVAYFVRGEEPAFLNAYERLTMLPASQVVSAPSLDSDGVRELAVSLALLGCGLQHSKWALDVASTSNGTKGALRVTQSVGGERALAFVSSGRAAIELVRKGPFSNTASDWVMVHCDDPAASLPRSPSAPLGRTGSVASGDVTIRQLLRESPNLNTLERHFGLQVGLRP
jgi:hypothetical protein